MKEIEAERILAATYIGSALVSVTCMICLVTAWQHWAWTLDVCINIDCGCILYGIKTFSTFMGGDVKLCQFAVYSAIPFTLFGLCLGLYHGYRCCIHRNLAEPRRVAGWDLQNRNGSRNNGEVIVVSPKRRSPCKQWMLAAFLAVVLSCLSLAHAVVITDGYYKTCEQYRRNLIDLLGSRGREAEVVYNRLSCGAILDFMDYLQPDTNNWRRGSEINTGFALQLGIVCSWFNLIGWVAGCAINIIMARNRLIELGEQFWCC